MPRGIPNKPKPDEPEQQPEATPQADPVQPTPPAVQPIPIVNIDDPLPAAGEQSDEPQGTRFVFMEIQVFQFPDGTSYHVQQQRATITKPELIANLIEAAKNPSNKIFTE